MSRESSEFGYVLSNRFARGLVLAMEMKSFGNYKWFGLVMPLEGVHQLVIRLVLQKCW